MNEDDQKLNRWHLQLLNDLLNIACTQHDYVSNKWNTLRHTYILIKITENITKCSHIITFDIVFSCDLVKEPSAEFTNRWLFRLM